MRTILIFSCILIGIIIGFYFKHRQSTSKHKDNIGLSSDDNKSSQYNHIEDNSFKNSQKNNYDEILIGEWDLIATDESPFAVELITAKITFHESHNFDLYVTAKYYNEKIGLIDWKKREGLIQGGSMSGIWQNIDQSFKLTPQKCNISTSYQHSYSCFKGLQNLSCDFFNERSFGNVHGEKYELELKLLNSDTIYISGKDFSKDADLEYLFTKN